MITNQLLHPASIVVVGASNNVHKPGGAILRNLISGGYAGEMRAVNPKETEVQGVAAYADVKDIPDTDLAILAIPAVMCPNAVEVLAAEKQVRAFIILSAGFGEETHEGALLEDRILETVNKYGASLIGPNCIGLMNTWHHSVFSQPIPNLHPQGADPVPVQLRYLYWKARLPRGCSSILCGLWAMPSRLGWKTCCNIWTSILIRKRIPG